MAAAKPAKKQDPEEDAPKKPDAEGDGAEGGEGVDLPKKKISGKKLVLIVAVLVLVLALGGGAALYFSGIFGGPTAEEEQAATEEHATEAAAEETGPPVFFEIPQILINLQSTGRRPSFLRLKISLQLKKEEDKAAVTNVLPRVVDSFQLYLREVSREELQGTAGLERLREELRLRVAAALAPVEIKDVLFTEMIFGD